MKTYVNIILFIFFISISCQKSDKEANNPAIENVVLSIISAKTNEQPLILILDFDKHRIIVPKINITTGIVPPPPENSYEPVPNITNKLKSEVISISAQEVEKLLNILSSFQKEDLSSQSKSAYDGVGMSINIIYNDNKIKNINLLNDSTQNQQQFFRQFFDILFEKSENSEFLKEIYPEQNLK